MSLSSCPGEAYKVGVHATLQLAGWHCAVTAVAATDATVVSPPPARILRYDLGNLNSMLSMAIVTTLLTLVPLQQEAVFITKLTADGVYVVFGMCTSQCLHAVCT